MGEVHELVEEGVWVLRRGDETSREFMRNESKEEERQAAWSRNRRHHGWEDVGQVSCC